AAAGGGRRWGRACLGGGRGAGYGRGGGGPPVGLRGKGAPPILVVGTTRDPATPFRWARALAGDLKSGVLLGWNGDGHTAYMRGSSCVDSAVDKYLISLVVPRDGTVCS